jgi:branched-chain amino acid transport system substrate-binding protein
MNRRISAEVPRRILASLLGCALAILAPVAAEAAASCTGPIKIGLTAPMSGNLALLGVQARNGVEIAVDDINKTGGIAGQKVELDAEDTGSSATDALNVAQRVIESKPLVIFGSMISPHVFAQTEAVTKAKIPFIVAATNGQITAQGSPWLFRISVHDGQLADLVPRYLVESMKRTKPAILAVADDYGLGASKGMQATLASLKIKPVAVASYAPTDKDMTAQLLSLKDAGADSLILFGRPGDVAIVMKQRSDLGIDIPVIGNASIVAQTTLNNLSAAEADGGTAIGGMIAQTAKDPKVLDWAKRVLDRYKVPADNFTVSYTDGMYLLKSIVEKVGCDQAAIRDALAATKGWQGMLIQYTADSKGDLAHTLGIYRNKGKTPDFVGPISEQGF